MNKQELTAKAIELIESDNETIKAKFELLDAGNTAVLAIWALLIGKCALFIKETGVEKNKAWTLYFQPYLEKTYPKRGWGIKTMQSYRRVNADTKKTAEYLAGEFELSTGRKKTVAKLTVDKKLANAVTTFNNLVNKVIEGGKKVKAAVDSKGLVTATIE